MDNNKDFEKLIKKDRDLHQARSWRGNLLGYLDEVKADPSIAKLAHARLYDVIMKVGVRDIQDSGDPMSGVFIKMSPSKSTISLRMSSSESKRPSPQIVRYFHAASLKGEESRQVLYLMGGPVGSGKALWLRSFTAAWKTASLLRHRRVPDVRGSTPPDPAHLRKEFEKMLGVHLEGDLCPCAAID